MSVLCLRNTAALMRMPSLDALRLLVNLHAARVSEMLRSGRLLQLRLGAQSRVAVFGSDGDVRARARAEGEVLGEQEVLDEVKKRATRIAKKQKQKQRQRGHYRGGRGGGVGVGGGMQLYIPNSEVFKKIWADRHKQVRVLCYVTCQVHILTCCSFAIT